MVAQNFRRGPHLAHDLFGSDCACGILDDVLGDEREQLRFADYSSGKRAARDLHWALPDRSTSDVSRRDHFDFVHAAGAGLLLGAARFRTDYSYYYSATFERGKNSSSGVGRLFRILPEHAVPAYPASLVSTNRNGTFSCQSTRYMAMPLSSLG